MMYVNEIELFELALLLTLGVWVIGFSMGLCAARFEEWVRR